VGHTANTSLHLAESIAEMPYVNLPYEPRWGDPYLIDESCETVSVPQTKFPGCSSHFGVMEGLFKLNGLIRYALVGDAVCQLMDMKSIVDFTTELLEEQPDFLLCHEPKCPACGIRRQALSVAIHPYVC
jgi:aminoglycoside 3-N-acetyltransferase